MKKRIIYACGLMLSTLVAEAQETISTDGPKVLTLAQCRQMALENSEKLKSSENNVKAAELDKKSAFYAYLPTIDGTLGTMLMKDIEMEGMGTVKMSGAYLAGLSLTQPLYAGGQIVVGNKMAKVAQGLAAEQQRLTRMEVLANVDNAYYTLVSVHEKVKMLEAYMSMMDTLSRKTQRSVDTQMATKGELLRVNSQKSQILYNLQKARNGEKLCQLALSDAISGELSTNIMPADTSISFTMPTGLSDDISQRPEVKLLQGNVDIKELTVRKEKSNFLPQVGLSGNFCYYGNIRMEGQTMVDAGDGNMVPYDYETKYNGSNWMVMGVANIPIWHWGTEFNKVRKAKLDLENSRMELEENKRKLTLQVQQAILNVTDGYTMIETAQLALDQATESLRQMNVRYNNSFATLTDLLQAQTQWQEAKSNLIEAQTQYKIYETEYKRVTGTLE